MTGPDRPDPRDYADRPRRREADRPTPDEYARTVPAGYRPGLAPGDRSPDLPPW